VDHTSKMVENTNKCILFVKDYPRIFMQISHLNDADVKEMSIFEINFPWQPNSNI
jgi:hypothetical protein